MTVEALIFIAMGLLAFGFILKAASASSVNRKNSSSVEKSIREKLKDSAPLPDGFEAELNKIIESKKYIDAMKYIRTTTKLDLRDSKQLVDLVKAGKNLHSLLPANGNRHALDLDEITKELERLPQRREMAPTAELQTIGDVDAFQRAQILVDKGQIIEAVKYLVDNAGFDMTKAVNAVDSMGKKVYPAD